MTFKRGDKVWWRIGFRSDPSRPAVIERWLSLCVDIRFLRRDGKIDVASLTPNDAVYRIAPRTEHVPELDGEEAPRG